MRRTAVIETSTQPSSTAPGNTPILSVQGLRKSYRTRTGDQFVLDDVDLDVATGEFVCLVGPSGAGKTTLLRCMSGLMPPTAGTVQVQGRVVDRPPAEIAVVFQDYSRSLMPWMSVERNVMLPLRSKGMPKTERIATAQAALIAVGLDGTGTKYPWQLSGGMQQRVAIARALAYEPRALLMDEPFASVDAQTRADLEDLVLSVRDAFGMTIVLVTHDIDEAVYLGDRVVVLSGSPTRVREEITVDLGPNRDQLATKALPEFVALRTRVLRLIREANA
ncbi:ABC transporter ATP-binding protein [Kribbella qitaiheensis]|uniref:ABC transporter ATP-binding protein n=1 Tax=Kribbella qitaiheensis TaxID=1544730 RepID=A0A7G6X526_9ACTN|nr:ABC transporter ATP-binding protein [Kribbella qitaiheensis]